MTSLRLSTAGLGLALVALCPAVMGCAAIAGDQVAPVDIVVTPRPDGSFGYSDMLSVNDPSNTTDAILLSVTFDTGDPPLPDDLTYLLDITGTGSNPEGTMIAQFCSASSFPAGEQAVTGKVDYHDNIVPFFTNSAILLKWEGHVNPAVPIPDGGYTVRARLQVEPQ